MWRRGLGRVSERQGYQKKSAGAAGHFQSRPRRFFLLKTSATGEENAKAIINAVQKIFGILENQLLPFIARVHPDGKVELWLNHRGVDLLAEKEARRRDKRKR